MRTSSSGLLLLLVAILGLVGFLTGNLDRWMGWLFDPSKPPLSGPASSSGAPAGSGSAPSAAMVVPGLTGQPASSLVSIGSTTTRQTA